jgi:hypothetical protein
VNRSTTGFTALAWGLSTDKPIVDDFDGDAKADFTVFRATADGTMPDYYTLLSGTSTVSYLSWGIPGDIPLTEDFDGDNKADHTIFVHRPDNSGFVAAPMDRSSPRARIRAPLHSSEILTETAVAISRRSQTDSG